MTDTRHIAIERFFTQVTRNVADAEFNAVAFAVEMAKLETIVANREEAARAELREAVDLLREEAETNFCLESPSVNGDVTKPFCIDLTDPNGVATCWPCRARRALATPPEPQR